MSLERLPWEPVANESLGFPLHLEPRFLVIVFPWQRMSPIPCLAPGPPGQIKLLIMSARGIYSV